MDASGVPVTDACSEIDGYVRGLIGGDREYCGREQVLRFYLQKRVKPARQLVDPASALLHAVVPSALQPVSDKNLHTAPAALSQ